LYNEKLEEEVNDEKKNFHIPESIIHIIMSQTFLRSFFFFSHSYLWCQHRFLNNFSLHLFIFYVSFFLHHITYFCVVGIWTLIKYNLKIDLMSFTLTSVLSTLVVCCWWCSSRHFQQYPPLTLFFTIFYVFFGWCSWTFVRIIFRFALGKKRVFFQVFFSSYVKILCEISFSTTMKRERSIFDNFRLFWRHSI
jgi:hypothetical protein